MIDTKTDGEESNIKKVKNFSSGYKDCGKCGVDYNYKHSISCPKCARIEVEKQEAKEKEISDIAEYKHRKKIDMLFKMIREAERK